MSKLSRFAGLMGFGPDAKKSDDAPDDNMAKAEKPKREDYDSDQEFDDAVKDWEDKQDNPDGKKAEADEKDDKDKKDDAKKAKAEGVIEGVAAERTRWATVLGSKEAEGKVVPACDLLADSDMDTAAITKILGKLGAVSTRSALSARHAAPTPAPATGDGHDDTTKGKGKFGARVEAAVAKAGGLRPGIAKKA